jgi:hypothetical protein
MGRLLLALVLAVTVAQPPTTVAAAVPPALLVAVGDLACDPAWCSPSHAQAVHDAATQTGAAAYLLLGDLQYEAGELALYQSVFDPIWGDVKDRLWPVMGNHELGGDGRSGPWSDQGGGYLDYWGGTGGRARPHGRSYYSFNVALPGGTGHLHVAVVNSGCGKYVREDWGTPRCEAASPQALWLAADLRADTSACTVVASHEPPWATRTSLTPDWQDVAARPLWQVADQQGVALWLAAHNHAYEYLAPMNASGALDWSGVREAIVGTGGRSLATFTGTPAPNSVKRISGRFGFLAVEKISGGLRTSFVATDGTVLDQHAFGC